MIPPGFGRYLAEWAALVAGLLLLGEGLGPRLIGPEHRAAVVGGVLVVAVADVPVYLLVRHGLLERPSRFMVLWGISVLGKLAWFGAAAAAVIVLGLAPTKPFVLVLGASFPLFAGHQVVRLVRAARGPVVPRGPQ